MTRRSPYTLAVVVLVALLTVTGCGGEEFVDKVSSVGAQGTGQGAYTLTAVIPSAAGLVPNAPVMLNDSAVGSVGKIEIENWQAKLTLRLNKGTKVPSGSYAMIGMTSVLGSSHLALVPPAKPTGTYLSAGASLETAKCPEQQQVGQASGPAEPDITLAQGIDPCSYPTTEQVLSSLSVVLNGGGLAQLGDVVHELGDVFGGREDVLVNLVPRLNTLVSDLNRQTTNIVAAMDGMNRLTETINAQTPTVQRALKSGPEILSLLVDQRQNLTTALEAVGRLSSTTNDVLAKNTDDIKTIVPSLRKLLDQLRTTGPALSNSLRLLLTFPFIEDMIPTIIKGDYVNSDLVLDLTYNRLSKSMIASLGLTGPEGVLGKSAGNSRGGSNPFQVPIDPEALLPAQPKNKANPKPPNLQKKQGGSQK